VTVHRLPSELRWIGFDLDDTLHRLFLAGACASLTSRARAIGRRRLEGAAAVVAWLGPIAAALFALVGALATRGRADV